MSDEKRKPDAGDTVREGVRSMVGILGALKDAIEQEFEHLRGTGERAPDPAPDADAGSKEPVTDPVVDLRDRFDFVSRTQLDALRQEVDRLTARVATLEQRAGRGPQDTDEKPAAKPPEPPTERPFRIDSD
jgi:hypothetical protein